MDPNGTFSIGKMMIQWKTRGFFAIVRESHMVLFGTRILINFYYIVIFGDSWIDLVWPTY